MFIFPVGIQAMVSGTPYYLGGPQFTKQLEPKIDAIIREVKEETFLSLYKYDIDDYPVHNHNMCFLTDTKISYIDNTTKLCVDNQNIDIYGEWAKSNGVDMMSSEEILTLEEKLSIYRKDKDFNRIFRHYKVGVTILGNLDTLLKFYTEDIHDIEEAPHIDIRPYDIGVLLVPLRIIANMCRIKKYLI